MMPCIISNLRAAITPRSHEVKASTPHVWDAAALIDEPDRSLMTGDGGKQTPSSSQGLMFNQTLTHPEPRGRRATKEISTSHSDTQWQHNAHWRSGSPTDCLHIVCIAKWAEWCHAPCLQRANGFFSLFFFSFRALSRRLSWIKDTKAVRQTTRIPQENVKHISLWYSRTDELSL